MKKYKIIDHTSDLGFEFYGDHLKELFVVAGEGLFSAIIDCEEVLCVEHFEIELEGADLEDLMVNWLRELLYLHQVKRMLLKRFEILEIDEAKLKGRVSGEKYEERRHNIMREVKAVTYHDLKVKETNGGWMTKVIFDV
ncbi:MAG: archease [Proteobacteria bacterium]|nr:archease [Pseudomonadota bacterium]